MTRPAHSALPASWCSLLLLTAGAWSCSGHHSTTAPLGAGVVHFSADACQLELGTLIESPSASFTPWYGREAWKQEAPDLLGDLRPAFVCDLPALFSYPIAANATPQRLSTAVRRIRPSSEETIRAEVFWRQDGKLQSLIAVEILGSDDNWHELQVDLPVESGELVFAHRFAVSGLAEQSGLPVAWSQPVLAPLAKPQQPDVILLTIDTLRADAVQYAPYLEELMNSGKRWQAAYSPSNWTLPSYASLMTGLSPQEHGCGRGPFTPEPTGAVENRNFRALGVAPTVAEAMRDAGYATAMFYQNPLLESWTGLQRGFDRYLRTADRAPAHHQEACRWWQANSHRARFLTLHYMAPHLPYLPPASARGGLGVNPLDALHPESLFERDHSPMERQAFFDLPAASRAQVALWYQAEVAAMDAELRSLITTLRASSPDCLILIHADHGEELWDAGSFEHGHSFDDSVIHVPLAMVREGFLHAESITQPVAAHHLGTLMLEELGIPNRLPASSLGDAKQADRRIRSTFPLYRCAYGGRELQADGSWRVLAFNFEGSTGNPGIIQPETAARMAALGYTGERND